MKGETVRVAATTLLPSLDAASADHHFVVFALTVQFAPALALVEMVPGAVIELAAPATR